MHPLPRLADVCCTPVHFQPGDRIIVRLYQRMDGESMARLKRTVERWSGGQTEVLVVDTTIADLEIQQQVPLVK